MADMCQNLPFTISGLQWYPHCRGSLGWGCGQTVQAWMQEPGCDTIGKRGYLSIAGNCVTNKEQCWIFPPPGHMGIWCSGNTPSLVLGNEESCGSIPSVSNSFYENSNTHNLQIDVLSANNHNNMLRSLTNGYAINLALIHEWCHTSKLFYQYGQDFSLYLIIFLLF